MKSSVYLQIQFPPSSRWWSAACDRSTWPRQTRDQSSWPRPLARPVKASAQRARWKAGHLTRSSPPVLLDWALEKRMEEKRAKHVSWKLSELSPFFRRFHIFFIVSPFHKAKLSMATRDAGCISEHNKHTYTHTQRRQPVSGQATKTGETI